MSSKTITPRKSRATEAMLNFFERTRGTQPKRYFDEQSRITKIEDRCVCGNRARWDCRHCEKPLCAACAYSIHGPSDSMACHGCVRDREPSQWGGR